MIISGFDPVRREVARVTLNKLIVDGRIQGGYNDVYELICPSCGDRPDLDYFQVPPRLRWLRGPRTLEEGLAAYHGHLGLAW